MKKIVCLACVLISASAFGEGANGNFSGQEVKPNYGVIIVEDPPGGGGSQNCVKLNATAESKSGVKVKNATARNGKLFIQKK